MIDQYAAFLTVGGSFVVGLIVGALVVRGFMRGVSYEQLKEYVKDFIVSMDEANPSMTGALKKQRVMALVKQLAPKASPELVSSLIDTAVGLWRFETQGVAPKDREADTPASK